jgi:hypothetical protein
MTDQHDESRPHGNGRHQIMDAAGLVQAMRLGERQAEGALAVFPVFMEWPRRNGDHAARGDAANSDHDGGGGGGERPRPAYYVTLRQALAAGRARITEVSEGGSVPELRVVNGSDTRILLLDGEELRGAKQNRVLSTTILIDKHATLTVPVSCTERGRWSYASREFSESQVLAERNVRFSMKASVHAAAMFGRPLCADQGAVWSEVDALHARQGTHSSTGAMRDSYEARRVDLDRLVAAFPLQDGQNGLLVLHGPRVVGFDLVSRPKAYADLHDKLLRSYVFEALVSGGEPGDRAAADAFLERVAKLPGEQFKSPGLGWDVRFESDGLLGSILTYRGFVVHAAFFDVGGSGRAVDRQEQAPDGLGGDTRRRGYDGVAGGPEALRQPEWRIADARERARRRLGR